MKPLLSYDDAPVAIRDDIVEAHRQAWHHIASPGSWWTGAERVAIAREVRAAWSCGFCAERKTALSPYMLSGEHSRASDELPPGWSDLAPEVIIDAIHRIVTDPGRLGRRFYDDAIAAGLSDGHYVELLGVVLTVILVDMFCRALGVPPRPLPGPLPGEPDGFRPPTTDRIGAWVPTLDFRRASKPDSGFTMGPELAAIRNAPNVIHGLSLVPAEVDIRFPLAAAHYVPGLRTIDVRFNGGRTLSRPQMEIIAARVSAIQECFY